MIETSLDFKKAIDADQRYIDSRVLIYFDPEGEPEEFRRDDFVDWQVLKEVGSRGDNPLSNITANECSLILHNKDQQFNPNNVKSKYYGKLKPNVKFEVFISLEIKEGQFEEIKIGTFFTGDWDSKFSSLETSVLGRDRMINIINSPMPQISVIENIRVSDACKTIFFELGYSPSDYEINLIDDPMIDIAWFMEDKVGTTLQLFLDASFAGMFIDNEDKIIIKTLKTRSVETPVVKFTDNEQLIDISNPVKFLDTYSEVKINYGKPYISNAQEIINLSEFTLLPDMNEIKNITLNKPIARIEYIQILNSYNCFLKKFTLRNNLIDIYIDNLNDGNQDADIKIIGKTIENTPFTYIARNQDAIRDFGNKEMRIENIYLQDPIYIVKYAETMLRYLEDPQSEFHLEVRGNPSLELLDLIEVNSNSYGVKNQHIVITQMKLIYDGSLSGEIFGRKPILGDG